MSPEHIGQQIRKARKAADMTQEQLAAALHISRQTVSNWENARSQPDYQMLQDLAAMLHMNLAELFGAPPTAESPAAELPAEEARPADAPGPIPEPFPDSIAESAPAQIVQSAQGTPPESQVVQPEEPVQDAPPVVQPAAHKSRSVRILLLLAAAMLVLLCAGLPAAMRPSRSSAPAYTLAWFQQERAPVKGQALIDVYAKQDIIPLSPATPELPPMYNFSFFFREMQGVGFQPECVRFLFFFENGNYQESCLNRAQLASSPAMSSHINAYGLMRVMHQYPLTGGPAPQGVGCVMEGKDDHGNTLAFGEYVPFAPN